MKDDPKQLSVDDLEVSVKTSSVLDSLEVATVGELLALPAIGAPKPVITELQLLFEDFGLKYEGLFEEMEVEVEELEGDVPERWARIADWLDENYPSALEDFNGPADDATIATAEGALGRTLPEEYATFLHLHNGQKPYAPMVHTCSLFAVETLAENHRRLVKLFKDPASLPRDAVEEGIEPIEYSPSWIPIGSSARGRDFLCLDLAPAAGGHVGQVILIAVDDDPRELVAKDFQDFLSLYFEELQTGEIEFDEE